MRHLALVLLAAASLVSLGSAQQFLDVNWNRNSSPFSIDRSGDGFAMRFDLPQASRLSNIQFELGTCGQNAGSILTFSIRRIGPDGSLPLNDQRFVKTEPIRQSSNTPYRFDFNGSPEIAAGAYYMRFDFTSCRTTGNWRMPGAAPTGAARKNTYTRVNGQWRGPTASPVRYRIEYSTADFQVTGSACDGSPGCSNTPEESFNMATQHYTNVISGLRAVRVQTAGGMSRDFCKVAVLVRNPYNSPEQLRLELKSDYRTPMTADWITVPPGGLQRIERTMPTPVTIAAGANLWVMMEYGRAGVGRGFLVPSLTEVGSPGQDLQWRRRQANGSWSTASSSAWKLEVFTTDGTVQRPRISANLPRAGGGSQHTIRLSGTRPSTPFAFNLAASGQAIDMTPIGAPGCTSYVNPQISVGGLTDRFGETEISFPIPVNAIGVRLYSQYLVVDPTSNALGLLFSARGESTTG